MDPLVTFLVARTTADTPTAAATLEVITLCATTLDDPAATFTTRLLADQVLTLLARHHASDPDFDPEWTL